MLPLTSYGARITAFVSSASPGVAGTSIVVPVFGVVAPLLLLPAPTAFALTFRIAAVILIWVLRPKG